MLDTTAYFKKFGLSIGQAAAIAFLLLSLAAPALLKPYVDTFAFGTSYARVYGLGVYFVILAFAQPVLNAFFQALKRMGRKNELKMLQEKLLPAMDGKILAFALLALFLYGVAGQYLFVTGIGGSLNTKYFIFDERGFTSSHINHIHALKTIFCPFDPSDDVDCARPMLPYLPWFYPYIGMILAAVALAASVAFSTKLKNNADKVAFAILSFAVIKTSLDGGLLNFEDLSFFMLVPFALSSKHRLAFTLVGVLLWYPVTNVLYSNFDPVKLAIPMLAFFYPIAIVAHKPRYLFPLLVICLVAPNYLLTSSDVVKERWEPEACQNAGVTPEFSLTVTGTMYTPCSAQAALSCGTVNAANGTAEYSGYSTRKPELIISKSLANECKHGVFSFENMVGSIKVLDAPRPVN